MKTQRSRWIVWVVKATDLLVGVQQSAMGLVYEWDGDAGTNDRYTKSNCSVLINYPYKEKNDYTISLL